MSELAKCEVCGEPMPAGEQMFKFHGYSGECPKPPLPRPAKPSYEQLSADLSEAVAALKPFANFHCNDPTCKCNNCVARAIVARLGG